RAVPRRGPALAADADRDPGGAGAARAALRPEGEAHGQGRVAGLDGAAPRGPAAARRPLSRGPTRSGGEAVGAADPVPRRLGLAIGLARRVAHAHAVTLADARAEPHPAAPPPRRALH